ncbi:hypothetical protein [Thiorhodococcus mannitoliphagus]|uniref:hypothetical protein n=1 Tax=Thiorhodococcus mannitoliphagus TaxID=329406 RepID=UPI0030B8E45D
MLRERRTCQPSERGRIGLRVRTATASAQGMFQIEWYRVQGKQRTKYLRRSAPGDFDLRARLAGEQA